MLTAEDVDSVAAFQLVEITEPLVETSDPRLRKITPSSYFVFQRDGTVQKRVREHLHDTRDALVYPNWDAGIAALLGRLAVNLEKAAMNMSQVARAAYRQSQRYEAAEPIPL